MSLDICGAQECFDCSHDVDRCVAWKYVTMDLHWSARDFVPVYNVMEVHS